MIPGLQKTATTELLKDAGAIASSSPLSLPSTFRPGKHSQVVNLRKWIHCHMPTFLRFLTPLSKLYQGSFNITPSSPSGEMQWLGWKELLQQWIRTSSRCPHQNPESWITGKCPWQSILTYPASVYLLWSKHLKTHTHGVPTVPARLCHQAWPFLWQTGCFFPSRVCTSSCIIICVGAGKWVRVGLGENLRMRSFGEVPASGDVIACPPGKGDSSPLTRRNRLFLPARESGVPASVSPCWGSASHSFLMKSWPWPRGMLRLYS